MFPSGPFTTVHLIDSLIWLSEKPLAPLANVRALSSLMQFCMVCQKTSSRGDSFRRVIHKHKDLWFPFSHPLVFDWHIIWASTPTAVGSRGLNKMDGPPLEGLCVICFLIWLSKKPARRYICLSIRALTEISPVRHTAYLFTCASSLCCIRFPHAPAASRPERLCQCSLWGLCSAHLYLICKCDKTPHSPQMWDSPGLSQQRRDLNWKCGLMSGLRGMIGAVHPIRRMFQLLRCTQ